jgi:cell division ATPase FtsA
VFQTQVRVGTPLCTAANGNGSAGPADSPVFAAAIGLVEYGAHPRDYVPAHADEARLFGKVRQRLKGWMEAFF